MDTELFTRRNIVYLAISLVLLVVGYICLAQGPVDNPLSWSVAPVILVLVYCAAFPLTIIVRGKKDKAAAGKSTSTGV